MAEKTPKGNKEESPEFATQKIDRDELLKAESSAGSEFATRKIEADKLESNKAQEAMESSATMKISQGELLKAMDEEMGEPEKTPPVSKKESKPESKGEIESEKPLMENKQEMDMKSRVSSMNTTNVTIIAVSAVLLACICGFTLIGLTALFLAFGN